MRHHLELSHSVEAENGTISQPSQSDTGKYAALGPNIMSPEAENGKETDKGLPVISSSYTISGASFYKSRYEPKGLSADTQPEPVQAMSEMVESWMTKEQLPLVEPTKPLENVGALQTNNQKQGPATNGLRPIVAATRRVEGRAQQQHQQKQQKLQQQQQHQQQEQQHQQQQQQHKQQQLNVVGQASDKAGTQKYLFDDDIVILEPKKEPQTETAVEEEKSCPWCNMTTRDMDVMSRHIQEEHLGIKSNKPEKKRRSESPGLDKGSSSSPKRVRVSDSPKRSQKSPQVHEKVPSSMKVGTSNHVTLEEEEMPSFELKKCPQCSFTAPTKTQISHHMDGTHRVAILKCEGCFYSTTNSVHLMRHIEDFHAQDVSAPENASNVTNTKPPQPLPFARKSLPPIEESWIGSRGGMCLPPERNPVPSKDYSRMQSPIVPTPPRAMPPPMDMGSAPEKASAEVTTEADQVPDEVTKVTDEIPKVTKEAEKVVNDTAKVINDTAKVINDTALEFEVIVTGAKGSSINNSDVKKCPDCDFTTVERYGITKHVRDVHGILGESKCGLCKYEAEDDGFLLDLAKHIDNFHGKKNPLMQQIGKKSSNKCPYCKFEVLGPHPHPRRLLHHIERQHPKRYLLNL